MLPQRHYLILASVAGLVALATGCGGSNKSGGGDTAGGFSGGTVPSFPTDSGETTMPTLGAKWVGLFGELGVREGTVEPEASVVGLRFYDDDAPSLDLPLCEAIYTIATLPAPSPDPDVSMYAWWDVQLTAPSDCAAQPYPAAMAFGIGPYDPLLDPAMARAGLVSEPMNGLYAQLGAGTPLYVFGIAGTQEQFDGSALPVAEAPVPDAVYLLQTLHLLPIEPAAR